MMGTSPSPAELWDQAGGDSEQFSRLMREAGHIARCECSCHEDGGGHCERCRPRLPCGWEPEPARIRASVSHAATAEPGSGQAEARHPGERSVDPGASGEAHEPAREGRGEADHLAEIAYRTWQRERGVPGDTHWEAMPPAVQAAWRATAMAIADAAAPAIRADERERWRTVLADHYLMGINCDSDTKRDNPMCGCSRINLGWYPSMGEAREAWIGHVLSVLEDGHA